MLVDDFLRQIEPNEVDLYLALGWRLSGPFSDRPPSVIPPKCLLISPLSEGVSRETGFARS